MAFTENIPDWQEPGIEPPLSKRTTGWQVGDKPPAAWLNWFFNRVSKVLQEIRDKVVEKTTYDSHVGDGVKHVTAAERSNWNSKVNAASPSFTGIPLAPTAAPGTNTTQIANAAFVQAAIASMINGAPLALDTLLELATAMGNDPNFATTMTNALALKAPLASPAFSGSPTVPTAAAATNTTQVASTQFVQTAVAAATPAKAKVTNSLLSALTATTVATYTAPVVGNYLVGIYLRVVTATTTVTVSVTYTDATGAQTTTVANALVFAVGSYSLLPVFLAAASGAAINVVVTAGTINQVYASASIVGV